MINRMSEDTWFVGIHREETDRRPLYIVEWIPAEGKISIPFKEGFSSVDADEPYFRIVNTMTHGCLSIPFSRFKAAGEKVGVELGLVFKDRYGKTELVSLEAMYESSSKTGLDMFSPKPGGGYICRGCSKKTLDGCLESGMKLERFNDNMEYCQTGEG